MDISFIFVVVLFFLRIVEALLICGYYPFIYKFGLIIMDENLNKFEMIDISHKIGREYEKKYTKIKVMSENEFYFIPKYHAIIDRMWPYLINKCEIINEEYKIISKIPLSYIIIALIAFIVFLIKKEIIFEIQIISYLYIFFLIVSLTANNWMMRYMKKDIDEFLSGLEL